jgi:hypothetical protein
MVTLATAYAPRELRVERLREAWSARDHGE